MEIQLPSINSLKTLEVVLTENFVTSFFLFLSDVFPLLKLWCKGSRHLTEAAESTLV